MKQLKPNKKEIYVGDVIEVKPKEFVESLRNDVKDIDAVQQEIVHLSIGLAQKQRSLWATIHEKYPETKKFMLAFNAKSHTIIVKRHLTEREIQMADDEIKD